MNNSTSAKIGRYMMDMTYRVGDNYELANTLSRLGEDLTDLNSPFARRWNDFTGTEKAIIRQCFKKMKEEDWHDLGQIDKLPETDTKRVLCTLP